MKDNIDWEEANRVINSELSSGIAGFLVKQSHRDLARFGNNYAAENPSILEIGAGNGAHFNFVRKDFSSYTMTDISTWGKSEIDKIIKSNPGVTFALADVQNLLFPDKSFDRVICSCVLIHVDQPYLALQEMKRVTKIGGSLSIYIAADPGVLLSFMRFVFTKPKIKSLPVEYKLLNALSHRNHAGGLIEIAKYVFAGSKIKILYHPFRWKSWNLSTHIIINIIRLQ